MIIKGKNQHVIPNNSGWDVVDEADLLVVRQFHTQKEALDYAHERAAACEGEVLLHSSPCAPGNLPTVPLPQREVREATGFVQAPSHGPNAQASNNPAKPGTSPHDAFLGFDRSDFDI